MRIMRLVAVLLLALAATAAAQTRTATLRIVVADPTGAVIVGATVAAQPVESAGEPARAVTNERGEAVFEALPQGRYTVTAEAAGFEPKQLVDLRLRGDARREVKLDLAKLATEITVGQDPRERGTDPRGNAFANLLSRSQIDSLPDDPDEMEEALKEMAGPGAVVRVDGFRGGKLPPKSQIRGIRFRRDMFAAENHGGGMVFVDITTQPGWRSVPGNRGLHLPRRIAEREKPDGAGARTRTAAEHGVHRLGNVVEEPHGLLVLEQRGHGI